MVFSLLMASSSISYAATPTIDSDFSPLVVGTNDLKVENYDGSQTMAGCFTAPEEANYSFSVVNIGELTQDSYLLNNNFAQIDYTNYKKTTDSCSFGTYHLKMGEKIYFYARRTYKYVGTLASRLIISNESKQQTDIQANSNAATSTTTTNTQKTNNTTVSKSKVTISPKSCRLKKGNLGFQRQENCKCNIKGHCKRKTERNDLHLRYRKS